MRESVRLDAKDVGVLKVYPEVNGTDLCVAISRVFPNPDAYLPDSPEYKLCEMADHYMRSHRTERAITTPPPVHLVITTTSAGG